jgi:hypothetical protein
MNMKLKLSTALLAAAALLAPLSVMADQAQNAAEAKLAAVAVYGKLPLSFEPTGSAARFVAHSGGYTVSVGARESSIAITAGKPGKSQTLHFAFDNAAATPLEAMEPQPGVTNYYIGADSSQWRLGVKSYGKLRAQGVYPGIDVVYYGDHRRLEFDFVVAPKADPAAIALAFSGMDKLYRDSNGDLVAQVGGQPLRFARPYAYQKLDGATKPVAADYELAADGKVHLHLGDYDRSAELIVDPVVSYVTFLGGSLSDVANGVAVDGSGSAYVTGQTCSPDFPVSGVNDNGAFSGTCDAFVTKFTEDGTGFLYTTIIGGTTPSTSTAVGNGIAVDSTGQAYIVGTTNFTDLPDPDTTTVYTNLLNTWQGGDSDAFISILNASTGAVVRTSYLGGSNADAGYGIAVDSSSNVIVVGQTCSDDFPAYNAFQTKIEPCVGFITKLDNELHIATPTYGKYHIIQMAPPPAAPSGAAYYFSEFFGGQPVAPIHTSDWVASRYYFPGSIIQDSTTPTPNIQITFNGGVSGGAEPAWSTAALTYTVDGTITWENLGPLALIPDHNTWAYGVALDPLGDVFVAGGSTTPNIVSGVWPFETFLNAGTGAWLIKVNGQAAGKTGGWVYGSALENTVTTLGTVDTARAVAVDASGAAYVTGTITGALYGTSANSYKAAITGGQDAFLLKMNTAGSAVDYATYLGGSGNDQGLGVAVDTSSAAYVTGGTESVNFPTINPLTFPNGTPLLTLSGSEDAFITKFTTDGTALIFSAYLGGSALDQSNAIAVDAQGNMYVAGSTYSTDLEELNPTTYAPPQLQFGGGEGDAFVAKIAGSSIAIATVTPGTLDFPPQDVNTSSAPEPITYTNTNGVSSITISSIVFNNTEFAQFPMSGSNPLNPNNYANCTTGVILPLTSCDLWVVFTPAGQGNRSGTVTITDDASSTTHVIDLSGQGTVPEDALSVPSLTFAAQGVGTTSAAQSFTLQNIGVGTLFITSIAVAGANPTDFTQTNNCGTALLPQAICTITVTFTPGAAGVRGGNVTITDNASPGTHAVGLSGTGVLVNSSITTPTTPLTFPQQAINVASVAQKVTVTNTDASQTLIVSSVSTTGNFQANINTCSVPVTPGNSCIILVVFDPTTPGTLTGTLTITGNGATMPAIVALSGTAGATATLAPNLTFTGTNVGTTSAVQIVTLTNLSAFAFNVQSIAFGGTAAAEFSQTNTCGTSVSASGNCTISVTFKPTGTGNQNATLTVTSDAAASPQSVSILGVGTAPVATLSPATNSTITFPNQPLSASSLAIPITLTNTGTGPLNIPVGGITITGAAAGDFSQTNTCGTQVAVNAICAINVTFTPSALNSRSATLNIADDAIPSPQTIFLVGTGVQVKPPTVAPPSLTFTNQPLNQPSTAQTVTITNTDPVYTLSLSAPVTTGDFQVVAQTGSCGTSLAATASCVIAVAFTPTASGTRTGTLTVSTNGSSTPLLVPLTGTGGAAAAVNPTSLNLGSANVGESSLPLTVTLTNSSAFPVNITSVTLSGLGASEFVASNNCGTIVPASSACTVSVTFKPTATGNQTATLTIGSDAATPFAAVSLTGNGTAPVVSLSVQSLNFSPQAQNVPSNPLPVTLTNTGTGPLNFTSIAITGTASGDFSQTNNCGAQVIAGGNCVINVTFTPTALNSRIAGLVFTDDATFTPPTSPQTVALSGTGISGSGTISLSPTTLPFGNQLENTTSTPAQTVTLTNSSTTSVLTVTSIAISGNADFAIATNSCAATPFTLAVGASCSLTLTFTPKTLVLESATLTVTGSASNSPQQVTLTGTGTSSITSTAPFTVTPQSTGVSITENGTAQYILSVAPLNGFNNSINFTCSGPNGSTCSITPNPLTMDGTTVKTATLSVSTTGGSGAMSSVRFAARPILLALLPFSMMGLLLIGQRRGYLLVLMLIVLCLLLGMVGCGGGSSSSGSGLAPGTYQVVVTATSSVNSTQSQTMTLSLVVTPQ